MISKKGFTLIEVMISVMIVSVVIASLLQMNANNVNIFKNLKSQSKTDQYLTFLIDNQKYGFNNDENIPLYRLLEDFDLDDDFRRELKKQEITIKYQELDSIDFSEFEAQEDVTQDLDDDEKEKVNSSFVFEVGKSIIKHKNSSVSILRIKVKQ
jgi:prepilin-type N-terminal cleavage/methylation domain-containing protein